MGLCALLNKGHPLNKEIGLFPPINCLRIRTVLCIDMYAEGAAIVRISKHSLWVAVADSHRVELRCRGQHTPQIIS